ncbi:MAG TPA: ubiquinol-cytochrome c reductase iron-sulfur subunit [Nitrospirae bacterium]|nr:ubiquinol-cytochrome c reductase iron-sulfur subunit [Nitrospirota bacterium]HDZ88779.1 ubiquinol-cytochrome c reductase iron-sulfur subunit [Nitrospirota bacterium]
MVRRTFLKKTIKLFFFVVSSISISVFFLFSYPWKIRKKELTFFYVTDEDMLPVKGVRQVSIEYSRYSRPMRTKAYIVNTGSELFALSPVCSHLGCLVNWNWPRKRFLCPCHGGQYDITGNVIKGPPPAPLSRLPMKIDKEKVYIGLRV